MGMLDKQLKGQHNGLIPDCNYSCLEYIVVDWFRETGKYEVYSRSKILNCDNNYLKHFACRKALPHHSK
ncbi:hypothetical protein INT46_009939 [Mucor plumbeus]|uniref:Uncharacterized protein n=1 Tax=Mucor plumbeus TaxID=97098 RepID=A0A8H7RAA6_9FUNG|nr:hypothetical protein INT46_009939 [Mucor plumbeus]